MNTPRFDTRFKTNNTAAATPTTASKKSSREKSGPVIVHKVQ